MLKFFRSIRQNLIAKGKTGKYLKYAFGEIVLVMIGILLALQVSNWNDQSKLRDLEKRYISELILDLTTDSLAIAKYIEQSDLQVSSKLKLIEYMAKKDLAAEDSLSDYFVRQWALTYSFNPITTTLDEMKSTSNIGVVQNSDLRRKILETYNNYTLVINDIFWYLCKTTRRTLEGTIL